MTSVTHGGFYPLEKVHSELRKQPNHFLNYIFCHISVQNVCYEWIRNSKKTDFQKGTLRVIEKKSSLINRSRQKSACGRNNNNVPSRKMFHQFRARLFHSGVRALVHLAEEVKVQQ